MSVVSGQRVLVTGSGGELGSLVTSMIEEQSWAGDILGVDADPPRRRLHRAGFRRVALNRADQVADIITEFDPHIIVHLGVWEPNARLSPDEADGTTSDMGRALFDAARRTRSLEQIVLRSGIEVYGPRGYAPFTPNEASQVAPSSRFGRMLHQLERRAGEIRGERGIAVGTLRLAPVLGPHVPSPLGRLLRLPSVPFALAGDPPFTVVEDHDAAVAFTLAGKHRLDGVVNVVAEGTTTARKAALQGRRLPVPVTRLGWWPTRQVSNAAGAPIPDHVQELLKRGRLAHSTEAAHLIHFAPRHNTHEIIERLFEWPSVIRVPATKQVA